MRKIVCPLRPLPLLLAVGGWLTLPAFAQVSATALPTGGVVSAGSAAISQAGAAMRVDQASQKAVIDWTSFNIGRDASVHFQQPNASAIALNRVGSDGGHSIIDGRLIANGQVWLLNPGGVLIGPSARVDVGGLLATSLQIGNNDFLGGNTRFTKDGVGGVLNQGAITAAEGGYVAMLAPEVRNEGIIVARMGTVAMASGNAVRLDITNDRLIKVQVDQGLVNGLIENKHLIETDAGWAVMSAGTVGDIAAGAVNNTGVVRAQTLVEREGVILLEGGTVTLGGTISADGANGAKGGTVEVTAGRLLSLSDTISARSVDSAGGSVRYRSGDSIIETATSNTDVSGQTGGRIDAIAQGTVISSGQYRAVGSDGEGGRIDMSGASVRLLSSTLDASGTTQGGLVRVGGAFQGGKTQDMTSDTYQRYIGRFGLQPVLPNAQRTFINDSTRMDVSSASGAGGTAIVWSDQQTTFLGRIVARGGAVELSSANDLRHVNLTGLNLGTGHLLLDPKNIVIGTSADSGNWSYQAILGKGYSGGKNLNVADLEGGNQHSYPNYGDAFGLSLALNSAGNRMAVGSWDDGPTNASSLQGAVRLYSFSDGDFSGATLQGIIGKDYTGGKNINVAYPTPTGRMEFFGSSVSLNSAGDRLAVGVNGDGTDTGRGAVMLFSFADTSFSGGIHQASICNGCTGGKNINITLDPWVRFGSSVALNGTGDRLAAGVPYDDGPTDNGRGTVRLFSFTDTLFSGGSQVGIIGSGYTGGKNVNVTDLEVADEFGTSVALNAAGDRLAAGAHRDDGSGNTVSNSGAVRLFSFSDGSFSDGTLQGTIGKGYSGGKNVDVSGLENDDYFGVSVALNAAGDRLAVGAYGDDGSGNIANDSSAVHLFSFSDGNFTGGILQSTIGRGYTGGRNLDIAGLESGDRLGRSVAFNAAGDRLAVGASDDDGNGNVANDASGAVYLFSATPSANNANNALFATDPSSSVTMTPNELTYLLNAGTAVTLQANNDVTVSSAITANNTSGNGGNLTLQAGRNLTFNANVTTDNADLTAVAGDTGALANYRDSGTPTLTIASGVTLDVGNGTATLAAVGGNFVNNNGNSAIATTSSGHWLVYAADPATTTEGFTSYSKLFNQTYTAGATPNSSGNWFLYSLATDPDVTTVTPPPNSYEVVRDVVKDSTDPPVETDNEPKAGGIGNQIGTGPSLKHFIKPAAESRSDVLPSPPPKLIVDARKSVPRGAGVLTRADLQTISQQRQEARTILFADALIRLNENPSAADVPDCGAGGGGLCIAAARPLVKVDEGYIPEVKRKLAVLIGNNEYRSPIPMLETAINDVTAIAAELRDRLGYEVRIVQNAGRKDIVDALNQIIESTERNDSVLIMYAGHGYFNDKNQTGYWIPTDASPTTPEKWISNDTITKALANIPAKQVMLVSDSCYSGSLTKEGQVVETVKIAREKTLTRRSVTAMSSGGDEPVSDEGRDNHSIFAWNMINSLKSLSSEISGAKLHQAIKVAVTRDFSQTPQYGIVATAGHTQGGEYLLTPKKP